MTNRTEQFFARYEEGANTFDPDVVVPLYAEWMMGADPNGVACIHNDAAFRQAIPQRQAFFERIGFRKASVVNVEETALDDRYTMAKVLWHMVFEKQAGQPQDFRFFITYVLFDDGTGPKVVFYVSHDDERKVMREAGLID